MSPHISPSAGAFARINLPRVWQRVLLGTAAGLVLGVAGWWLSLEFRAAALAQLYQDGDGLRSVQQLTPNDPSILHDLALLYMYDPIELDLDRAQELLEAALRLSPYDGSLWLDYGRVLERQTRLVESKGACQSAMALAPAYFQPHWVFANLLLRSGETEAAYAALGGLTTRNPDAVANTLELVWQSSGEDARAVLSFVDKVRAPEVKAAAVAFLTSHGQYPAAISAWRGITDPPALYLSTGWKLLDELLNHQAWSLASQVSRAWMAAKDRVNQCWNGDLERPIQQDGLDWRTVSSQEVRVWQDDRVAHSGERSLALEFPGDSRVHFAGITHFLPVEPSTSYGLRFYHKASGLTAGSGLMLKIQDAADPQSWRVAYPVKPGEEWAEQKFTFRTGSRTRWLLLSVEREPASGFFDYVSGRVWLDDFTLTAGPTGG